MRRPLAASYSVTRCTAVSRRAKRIQCHAPAYPHCVMWESDEDRCSLHLQHRRRRVVHASCDRAYNVLILLCSSQHRWYKLHPKWYHSDSAAISSCRTSAGIKLMCLTPLTSLAQYKDTAKGALHDDHSLEFEPMEPVSRCTFSPRALPTSCTEAARSQSLSASINAPLTLLTQRIVLYPHLSAPYP